MVAPIDKLKVLFATFPIDEMDAGLWFVDYFRHSTINKQVNPTFKTKPSIVQLLLYIMIYVPDYVPPFIKVLQNLCAFISNVSLCIFTQDEI